MAESRAASGVDRLPWLADDTHVSHRRPRRAFVAFWVGGALLVIAAASYWLGWRVSDDTARFDGRPATRSTLAVPQAKEIQPEMPALPEQVDVPPVPLPPMPEIAEPAPIRIAPSPSPPRTVSPKPVARIAPSKEKKEKKAVEETKAEAPKPTYTTTPWPVRVEEGAAGRLVRVGVFSTRHTAKRGWTVLMRNNPSLQRLPALVVPVRSARNGKIYYRLQMGTSSQAHSTVLCQRMRMIGQSCVVLTSEVQSA